MSQTYTRGVKHKQRSKPIILISILVVAIGGAVVAVHLHGTHHTPPDKLVPAVTAHAPGPKATASINYALPVHLQIPKLQVDANVIYVGLAKDGSMDVPNNVTDTGWYKYGALPGSTGTAVIAGHLDGLRGEPGVFSELHKLAAGDKITVTESNGLIVSFTVRTTRSYPQTDQPSEVFHSTDGSHLNLITCTGSWDSSEHRFAERLVVFADKAI